MYEFPDWMPPEPEENCGAICLMLEEPISRVTADCPYHGRLEAGNRHVAYDTVRIFLDCGTMLDYGYGEWFAPQCRAMLKRPWGQCLQHARDGSDYCRRHAKSMAIHERKEASHAE